MTLTRDLNIGEDWTTANVWSDNLPAHSGADYNTNAHVLRSPPDAGPDLFPGDSLTVNALFRFKATASPSTVTINNFHLTTGGVIDQGNDIADTHLAGSLIVDNPSAVDDQASGARSFTIDSSISGSAQLTLQNATTALPLSITNAGNANTYTGGWNITQGYLFGKNSAATGSGPLGKGNIIIAAGAKLETDYNMTTPGSLTLQGNTSVFTLHQTDTFGAASINGTTLAPGTYSYATLSTSFPGNFPAGGSGSITVTPEPASIGLVGLALIAGLFRRGRRARD